MDFGLENIMELLGSMKSGVTYATELGQNVKALQNALNATQSLNDAEVKLALANLTAQVADAKISESGLKLQIADLEKALMDLSSFENDLARYELWETPASYLVYRLKQSEGGETPPHFLCPNCIEAKRKSILQGDGTKTCYSCDSQFIFEKWEPGEHTPLNIY